MICKICETTSIPFASAEIRKKYNVEYFRCPACGFVQTEEPYWLPEAYSEPINKSDTGLVNRNLILADITKAVISVFFNRRSRFIDYGGGYGLFVRLMRDSGFDFYRMDAHAPNIFARDYEAEPQGNKQYELMTSFEVFEHFAAPSQELEKMFNFSNNILFTTELIPGNCPKPGEWWYYGLDHGQHISFFTKKTLRVLSEKFKVRLYSNGRSIHLLTREKIPAWLFQAVTRRPIARCINLLSHVLS